MLVRLACEAVTGVSGSTASSTAGSSSQKVDGSKSVGRGSGWISRQAHGQLFLAKAQGCLRCRPFRSFEKPPRYWYMREDEQPQRHRYFVAHVAQISRGYAQASAVNSTDFGLSRLVRDQEDGGSNPLAPTNSFGTDNLQHAKERKTAWCSDRRSIVKRTSRLPIAES